MKKSDKSDKSLLKSTSLFFEGRKKRHEDSEITRGEKYQSRFLVGSLFSSLVAGLLLRLEVLPPLVAFCFGLLGLLCLIGSVIVVEINSFTRKNKKEVLQANPVQHDFTIKPYVLKNELMLNIREKEIGE